MSCFYNLYKKLKKKFSKKSNETIPIAKPRPRENRLYSIDLSRSEDIRKSDDPYRVKLNFSQVKNSILDRLNTM